MRQVIENGFPVICDECREMKRYEGPRKRQEIVCGCPRPEKRKGASPKYARRKGALAERNERKKLERVGVALVRMQPGSGAFGTRENETHLQGDNAFVIAGHRLRQEVKARASDTGFAVIKGWMRDCDVLTIKQDRLPSIHVLSDEAWLALVAAANRGQE